MRVLILAGTTEASALVRRLAGREDVEAVLSLAGRTQNPVLPPIPFRVGGFGGVDGLKTYLTEHRVDAVVDATHPFAAQMSRHAVAACGALGVPIAGFSRPGWAEQAGDRWVRVADMAAAVEALGVRPRRVFLTVGGVQLGVFAAAPWHWYLVRTIDPPGDRLGDPLGDPPGGLQFHRLILARGPFGVEEEVALMRDERIDTLVSKNSGGTATGAKIAAARALGIEVVMVERPAAEAYPMFERVDDVVAWMAGHRPAP
jgi:precorrin-6A/cobalt-precorrin-6A reductase